jgi:hypothetical protein
MVMHLESMNEFLWRNFSNLLGHFLRICPITQNQGFEKNLCVSGKRYMGTSTHLPLLYFFTFFCFTLYFLFMSNNFFILVPIPDSQFYLLDEYWQRYMSLLSRKEYIGKIFLKKFLFIFNNK